MFKLVETKKKWSNNDVIMNSGDGAYFGSSWTTSESGLPALGGPFPAVPSGSSSSSSLGIDPGKFGRDAGGGCTGRTGRSGTRRP